MNWNQSIKKGQFAVYNTNDCGLLKQNQNRAGAGQPHARGSGQALARQPRDASPVRIGEANAPGVGNGGADGHSGCNLGGQATITLFGCGPSITGVSRRAFKEVAEDQARRLGWTGLRRVQPSPSFTFEMAAAADAREAFPLHADEAAECGVSLLCAAELALAQD